jgi:predicted HicB family RNase H-like nuclease
MIKVMKYVRSIVLVDPKVHKELKKKLKKEKKSLSAFFREKAKEYVSKEK